MDGRIKSCIVLAVLSFSVPIIWLIIGGDQARGGDVIATMFTMILIVLAIAVAIPSLIIAAILTKKRHRQEIRDIRSGISEAENRHSDSEDSKGENQPK